MKRLALVFVALLSLYSCGDDDTPTTPPTPTIVGLTGTVSATGGSRIANATVKILDGPNAARTTTTNSNGEYAFDGLTSGNANLAASATIYDPVTLGVFINGTNTLNFVFPVPACQANNTAQVEFENVSANTIQEVSWDGVLVATLAPKQASPPMTVAAGVAHTLIFRNAATRLLACNTSTPVLSQCERTYFTCEG